MKRTVVFLIFVAVIHSSVAVDEIKAGIDVIGSSEPVSLQDMEAGWDGNFKPGKLAFADSDVYFSASKDIEFNQRQLGVITVGRTYRRYYYLSFDRQTSEYYRALDTTGVLDQDKNLELEVSHFEGPGVWFDYQLPAIEFNNSSFTFGASFSAYEPGHFQFGELNGTAFAGDASAASATIDYRYDQDKILDSNNAPSGFAVENIDKGRGYSFSVDGSYQWNQWRLDFSARDLVNQFQWDNGAITTGCINIGGGTQVQCESEGLASGVTKQQKITESIPATYSYAIHNQEVDGSLSLLNHDKYYRYAIEKGFRSKLGRFSVFLYHPVQLGVAWQYQAFKLHLAADDSNFDKARNLEMSIAVGWQW